MLKSQLKYRFNDKIFVIKSLDTENSIIEVAFLRLNPGLFPLGAVAGPQVYAGVLLICELPWSDYQLAHVHEPNERPNSVAIKTYS